MRWVRHSQVGGAAEDLAGREEAGEGPAQLVVPQVANGGGKQRGIQEGKGKGVGLGDRGGERLTDIHKCLLEGEE